MTLTVLSTVDAAHIHPAGAQAAGTKLRELSANSTIFALGSHTVALPRTCTITSILPKPVKGNDGVQRVNINIHRRVKLNVGTTAERDAPIVLKLDVSMPVGASSADLHDQLHFLGILLAGDQATTDDIFINGFIPGA